MFDPTVLTIKKGTTVNWMNQGGDSHEIESAKSTPQSFASSGLLNEGDDYSFTFDATGTYYYLCAQHPSDMRAIIKVVD
jgi:plastocyanin